VKKTKSQPGLANFASPGAGYPSGQLSALPRRKSRLVDCNLLTPAGDIFIHLIKMIVVPIVISTLVVGIAGVGDAKQLGRIGAKTIIYFEVITTVAIVLGITLANVFQPGTGIDMSQLAAVDISKYQIPPLRCRAMRMA
jgi:Na+/H+-dicarboxylate symporter